MGPHPKNKAKSKGKKSEKRVAFVEEYDADAKPTTEADGHPEKEGQAKEQADGGPHPKSKAKSKGKKGAKSASTDGSQSPSSTPSEAALVEEDDAYAKPTTEADGH